MSPLRSNPFETAATEYEAFVASGQVEHDALFTLREGLEKTGVLQIGEGRLKTHTYAETMHGIYSRTADLEVVPPLSETEVKFVAGKVATFGAMREATAPSRAKPKPTDTKKIATDRSKR